MPRTIVIVCSEVAVVTAAGAIIVAIAAGPVVIIPEPITIRPPQETRFGEKIATLTDKEHISADH